MRESTVQDEVCTHAKARGYFVRKVGAEANRGLPDCLFIYAGLFFFIEFKAPGKKATDKQAATMRDIMNHHINCFEVDNIDDGIAVIDAMADYGFITSLELTERVHPRSARTDVD